MTSQNLNISGAPTLIYSFPLSGSGHFSVFNQSNQPIYLSTSPTAGTAGALLVPQDGEMSFPNAFGSIYASSGNAITFGTPSTSLSSAAASGAGTVVVASTAGFSTPATFTIGTGTALEWVTANSYPGGGTVVLAKATLFDHASGATVQTYVSQVPSPLTVTVRVT